MQNKDEIFDLIKSHLPKYLSPDLQEDLFKKIHDYFPLSNNPDIVYFRLNDTKCLYQGDGMIDIPFSKLDIEKKGYITEYLNGALLSNTCDLINEYDRLENNHALYAAILPLEEYINKLKSRKISPDRIRSFLNDLKKNKITNLFYLPELKNKEEIIIKESFIRLDYCTSLPSEFIYSGKYDFSYQSIGDRLYSFSNYGFYLFLFKLSVHFCRFREGVFRNNESDNSILNDTKDSLISRFFSKLAHRFT